ncbi:MAG: 4-(cytidine 5'-diphospho)-2-C-methyl-D-erythritol kinase [Muribaculaceae bacterium]|nr:4-(cytidine 5'-diphospho)-2-C-methyl-D-erythritol kinase [Muribaculaceae bacterium]
MIQFINAKINLGLYIINRREDGYHDLSTVFYPVGKYNGTPENPEPFCDILEVVEQNAPSVLFQTLGMRDVTADYEEGDFRFFFLGNHIDCPSENNLIVKAARIFSEKTGTIGKHDIILEKHLPDGAGLGGGSADCSFLLKMLNEIAEDKLKVKINSEELKLIASGLGADCAFFIDNVPEYAEGIGEILSPLNVNLHGWWCLIVKPDVYVSTAEAFRGVRIEKPETSLETEILRSPEEWRGRIENRFEDTIFPEHPVLSEIKDKLYSSGAVYSSMSGSGSSLFGLYRERSEAQKAQSEFSGCYTSICKL